ncbi:MAG: hypothetical protein VB039_07545 [Oscillospiraceae bacterium]|nr:hypothetical protein [Oscillospiraceae bacterium]
MNFFKKPAVAVLMAIVIVLSSTLLSVDVKFGRECQNISDGFYDGVKANGYMQKSISTHLRNLCGYADGLVTIAGNYDIDAAAASDASEQLKLGLSYSTGEAAYLFQCYETLLGSVKQLEDQLGRAQLSERDASGVEQYSSSIAGVESSIQSAGYNESVREFLRESVQFPAGFFAELMNIKLPEYFA